MHVDTVWGCAGNASYKWENYVDAFCNIAECGFSVFMGVCVWGGGLL